MDAVAGFFFGFLPGRSHRVVAVEFSRHHFDQITRLTVGEDREAELTGEDDGALGAVVEQHPGAVAAIIGFAHLALPFAVAAFEFDGGFLHQAPVVRQHLFAEHPYFFVHVVSPLGTGTKIMRC